MQEVDICVPEKPAIAELGLVKLQRETGDTQHETGCKRCDGAL